MLIFFGRRGWGRCYSHFVSAVRVSGSWGNFEKLFRVERLSIFLDTYSAQNKSKKNRLEILFCPPVFLLRQLWNCTTAGLGFSKAKMYCNLITTWSIIYRDMVFVRLKKEIKTKWKTWISWKIKEGGKHYTVRSLKVVFLSTFNWGVWCTSRNARQFSDPL